MSELSLTKSRIQAGIWEGVLTAPEGYSGTPQISVTHLEAPVPSVAVSPDGAAELQWIVRVVIPPETLSDGVQTYLIWDTEANATLSSFTVVTGEPLEDDIRAEMDLIRAELDMLKRAFRRHCVETNQS